MLVRDPPRAVNFAVADGCADPYVGVLGIGSRSVKWFRLCANATSGPAEIVSERIS